MNAGPDITVGTQEDDGQYVARFGQAFLQFEAVHADHLEIEQYAAGIADGKLCQKVIAGLIKRRLVTGRSEYSRHRIAKQHIVVDDVDRRACCCHW